MIKLRRANERGRTDAGWLDSRHTFSFADYHDPSHLGFRALRVINDDRVDPCSVFGTHGHRDMEILSYVLSGALAHKDSMGNGSTIRPGDVQRMTAGTGVRHSEWNHSKTEPVHFLQIWIRPDQQGLDPGYEQKSFEADVLRDRLQMVASPDGPVTIHQDVSLYLSKLSAGKSVQLEIANGRHAWVHVATGAIVLNGLDMREGDGAAISDESRLELTAAQDSEVLVFDLA